MAREINSEYKCTKDITLNYNNLNEWSARPLCDIALRPRFPRMLGGI